MGNPGYGRRAAAGAAVLFALLGWAGPARAANYGGVEVTLEAEPPGEATHGYAEFWVRVVNRSGDAARTVRLTLPKSGYSRGRDYLRAVTRVVTVEPGGSVRVPLAYLERLPLTGDGIGVAVDGREYDDPLPLGGSRGYRSSWSGGHGLSGSAQPLVLYSRAVDTRFPDWIGAIQAATRRGGFVPLGIMLGSSPPSDVQLVRATQPVDAWSPNWLGYTRYDGLVVTADDLRAMPAEIRSAIGQYVECGGSLLVLGSGGPLPGPWKPQPGGTPDLTRCSSGFGQCIVTVHTDPTSPAALITPALPAAVESWSKTLAPWQREYSTADANQRFPVVEDLGVPVRGLLILMFLFAVAIGPVNLYLLARYRRRLWLFWTVPVVSAATCLGVFVSMALAEGWQGRSRVEGFTVLDENSRRASTLGCTAFYSPLLPGGGLHFSPETEVAYQNGEDSVGHYRRSGGSALTIDWTHDQHLASGWLTPRVPAHFVVRKSELRRERVTVRAGAGGRPEAVNGLGADLTDLWYADEKGQLFHAADVPAGGRVALERIDRPAGKGTARTLREVYAGGDWANLAERMATDGPALLAPRQYLGVMDAAPFLDDGLTKGGTRRSRSAVLGILKEGPDGG